MVQTDSPSGDPFPEHPAGHRPPGVLDDDSPLQLTPAGRAALEALRAEEDPEGG